MKVHYHNPVETEGSGEIELDMILAEVFGLLEQLLLPGSSLAVDASETCLLDFYVESDNSLWVEIADTKRRFWAASEIDLVAGKEILKIAAGGGEFGNSIPKHDREWDAYSRY